MSIKADPLKKNGSTKEIFSNIIGRIPPESYKKFKVNFDDSNNIEISETKQDDSDIYDEFTVY